jgi:hypothetical protein
MFIAGYSFLAEGTTNATWGGSTQGTLDDLPEQDNDIQEQSAGYSRLVNILKLCWPSSVLISIFCRCSLLFTKQIGVTVVF